MSRTNRRKRPTGDATDGGGAPVPTPTPTTERRRPLLRREVERVDNEPGYASPRPWSLRGTLTLYLVMMVINAPVALIAMKLYNAATYASSLVIVSPFIYLLYGLLAMPLARRLAQEPRRLRPLETLSAAALMYILYYVSVNIAVQLSGHNVDAADGRQLAGAGVAGLLGGAAGAALFPWIYRRFWMPRLPSARGGPRRGPRP
jgi:hypothetical protein